MVWWPVQTTFWLKVRVLLFLPRLAMSLNAMIVLVNSIDAFMLVNSIDAFNARAYEVPHDGHAQQRPHWKTVLVNNITLRSPCAKVTECNCQQCANNSRLHLAEVTDRNA